MCHTVADGEQLERICLEFVRVPIKKWRNLRLPLRVGVPTLTFLRAIRLPTSRVLPKPPELFIPLFSHVSIIINGADILFFWAEKQKQICPLYRQMECHTTYTIHIFRVVYA